MLSTSQQLAAIFRRMVEERHRELGRRVARLRRERGWTQPDLAHRAGVSIGTISRLERGAHEGRAHTIRQVAAALEVPVADLLPPPELPANGASQLDRIEATLDRLLVLVEAQGTDRFERDATDDPPPSAGRDEDTG